MSMTSVLKAPFRAFTAITARMVDSILFRITFFREHGSARRVAELSEFLREDLQIIKARLLRLEEGPAGGAGHGAGGPSVVRVGDYHAVVQSSGEVIYVDRLCASRMTSALGGSGRSLAKALADIVARFDVGSVTFEECSNPVLPQIVRSLTPDTCKIRVTGDSIDKAFWRFLSDSLAPNDRQISMGAGRGGEGRRTLAPSLDLVVVAAETPGQIVQVMREHPDRYASGVLFVFVSNADRPYERHSIRTALASLARDSHYMFTYEPDSGLFRDAKVGSAARLWAVGPYEGEYGVNRLASYLGPA